MDNIASPSASPARAEDDSARAATAPGAPPGRLYTLAVSGAVLLLLAAALFVYWPTRTPAANAPGAGQAAAAGSAPGMTYVSDLDFWRRTPRERLVHAVGYFDLAHDLNAVPMQIGDWHGEVRAETNQEVLILLQPEQYVQRLYRNSQGQAIWLSMVGGRSSQPFHAPDICYDADGWQYNLGSHPVPLAAGGSLYGIYLDAHKQVAGQAEPTQQVVFYFYLFPHASRAIADGIVLFKLTSNRMGTLEETLAIQEDFVRQFFDATPDTAPAAAAAHLVHA